MSDDEFDGPGGDDGMDTGTDGAVAFGAAQRFDASTGLPMRDDNDEEVEVIDDDARRISAAAHWSAALASHSSTSPLVETWHLSLAAKNAANTHDLSVPHMLGIDEAGRGPVLGSMVYGVCWCPVAKVDDLRAIKVADSKTLTFAQRSALFHTIQSTPWLGYEVDVLSADRLSRDMLKRTRINLNAISHDSAIQLIQKVIDHGVNVREVYVDTVGDPGKYQEKLSALFPNVNCTVSKKADSLFPIVSAASIAAKVTRDLNLDVWSFDEERPQPNGLLVNPTSSYSTMRCSRKLGSGYPGDPMTKVWLQNHLDPVFGYPSLVRFSWGTTKKLLKSDAVQVEWGDEDDEADGEDGEEDESAQKLGKFFSTATPASTNAAAAPSADVLAKSKSAPPLITSTANNKKFAPLHDSITSRQYAIAQKERAGWFQQHVMHVATTF